MRYYLIAGEASGDLHGSNLIKELRKKDPAASFRAWGGDEMEKAGAVLMKHIRELAFMGFTEVIRNLGTIMRNLSACKEDILSYKPDVLILIDYPGFNLRMATFAKLNHIRVVYYISPQVWAWKKNRVLRIKRDVDLMLVILPFEEEFYSRYDYAVKFVGHPLLDAIKTNEGRSDTLKGEGKNYVALLPGSRKQEIKNMLPVMVKVAERFPAYRFLIAGVRNVEAGFYHENGAKDLEVVYNKTYDLLSGAEAALVTSGTATLETALLGVPQAVCYKGSFISYLIARKLIEVKYISLVNLILDRPLIREIIQKDLNEETLAGELERLLTDENYRKTIEAGYAELTQKLGGSGASERAAEAILHLPEKG